MNFGTCCSGKVVDKMSVNHNTKNYSYHLDLTSHMFARNGGSIYVQNATIYTRRKLIYLFLMLGKRNKRGADVPVSHKMFSRTKFFNADKIV